MVLAKELVDKLKKIEDFDITYESSDKDSGEIYIDYNNIVFVLEHYIYEGKFCLSGGLHTITYKGKEYYSDVLPYYLDVDYDSDTYNGVDELVSMIEDDIKGCDFKKKLRRLISVVDSIYEDFDEVDKGFDLRYQVGLHNMLTNLPVMHGVKILAVSHTLIPMLLEDKVYAFKYRIMLSPSTYVALETGYSIKINDYNEREEV